MSSSGLALDDAAWSSPWRARAVRDKAVLAGALLGCAIGLPAWPGGVLAGVTAVAVLLGPARVRPGLLARCLLGPAVFLLLGAASVLVSVSLPGWGEVPRFAVTDQTVATAGSLLVRGFSATCALFVLATTTPMIDVLTALRRLRVPDACIDVASLTYRMLFVLLGSVATIHQAQVARLGYSSRRAALRSAGAAVASVLLLSWSRARRLEEGLAGRGYVDSLRTLDPPLHASTRFVLVSLLGAGALVAIALVVPR